MRILVNAVAVQGGGGRTYLVNMLDALVKASSHEYVVVLTTRQRELLAALPGGVGSRTCRGVPASPWLRVAWEQAVLPILARRCQADLFFAAFNTAPLLSPVPVVLVQHSVNAYSNLPIPWPAYMRARHAGLRWLGRQSSRIARCVLFVSETSARFMAPRLGVPPDRVRVIHYGWRQQDAGTSAASLLVALPERYVLTVGDLLDHKNIETLMDAFDRLVSDTSYPGDLVVVGRTQEDATDYARRLRQRVGQLKWPERVQFIGHVPPAVMTNLYERADLFALPSLEETFGLPLVEAMGAGTPVVATDWRLHPGTGDGGRTNVAPEICGDAAEFFDPLNPVSLAGAMGRVLSDPAHRDELVRRGRAQAARFSWTRGAEQLLQVFEEAVRPTSAHEARDGTIGPLMRGITAAWWWVWMTVIHLLALRALLVPGFRF